MGLVNAGWEAVSEDQCVIELDGRARHRVWPGPNWVRLKHGAVLPPLVAERSPRFEALDKIAWGIGDGIAHAPAEVRRIVLLEPAGGSEVVFEPLAEPEAIGALAKSSTWFQRQEAFASQVLPLVAKLGMSVDGFRMRLPRLPDWLERGVALLERECE
jgi:hypothetical protein